jgi:hypothetical protein
MPCRQASTFNGTAASSGSYRTEAECNQACQEGACCEGTVCAVKPQCQCQGAGQTFQGVGTTCDSISGACCEGTTCTVKPQCQCQGAGQEFRGVGTTCTPNPCTCVPGGLADFTVTINGLSRSVSIGANQFFSTNANYQVGGTQCGGNAYVSAWCENGTIAGYPLGRTCDNYAANRRRVVFQARISFGCAPVNLQGGCVGIWELDFVFDKFDPTTGVPIDPPCLVAGPVRPRFGTPEDCASCQPYIDCTAAGISASISASPNPLP